MTKANQQCQPPETMLDFLRGGLTSSEEESFQLHLDECLACRQLLSSSAADEAAWDEAHQFFSSEAQYEDQSLLIGTNGEQSEEPESIESLLRLLGPTDDPRMLGRIGSYEIVGVLGRGGMGVVFKAYEPSLNRYVAIKLLLPHLAASGAARMRFAREGRAAAAVIDDNVMPIFSVSEWQDIPYLVTQLSRGSNLQKRINDSGPLELREILRLGMQTASGLAAAHAQGLVHRDIKPSNILLDGTVDRALLTDFGLARAVDDASITCSGIIAGTPQYMSPEQARGGAVDARSDLFGLGSVLYTMCTGRPPFRAENSFAVLRLITDVHPRSIREINPDIPEWLCVIIAKLMSKSPEERYQSAAEVAELLSACLAHVQHPTVVDLPSDLREELARNRFANRSSEDWRRTLAHYITYRMPYWLPCFLTTLIAFAVSLGPAMTLPALPKETLLHSIPPATAVLIVTALGFAWGLAITVSAKRVADEADATEQPKKRHPFALFVIGGVIVALAIFIPWFMRQSRLTQELLDTKKQLLGATAVNESVVSSIEPTEPAAQPTMAATADERPVQTGIAGNAQQAGQIIGFLRNDLGEPVRNATIACSCVYDKTGKGGGANAVTDAEGRYQFSGLTEGIYSIWLKHYENPHFTAVADDGIEVTASQPAASSLSLVPTIHVSGLLTQEGKPATKGTPVSCFCSSRPESSATALTALTDDQGRFAFDLPYGRSTFFAMGRSQDNNVLLVAKAQIMVGHAKEAAKEPFGDVHLELRPQQSQFGSTDWLDRSTPGTEVVERKSAEDITGTIVDTKGNPIESAMIFTEADLQPVASDKNGFFRFPKAKGTQTIMRVFRQDYHIWMGMPTAGDRLKIVLESKETHLGLTSDNGGMSGNDVVVPQTCRILELLKPGPDDVEVNVGSDNGIKPGDKLDAVEEGLVIGKIEVTQAQKSRSKARIIEVVPGMALEQYQVRWKEMAQLKSFHGIWSYDVQEMWQWPAPIGLAINSEGRASEQRWQIDVSRNQITWMSQSAEPIYATFTIDPFKSPKEIDITIQSGPFKGMTSCGIYEFPKTDENFLWLCMTNPGSDAPRPTDVTSGSSLQQTMIGLHKIDPSEAITNENPINRFQGEFVMELCNSVDQRLYGNQAELQDWRWQVSGTEILWTRRDEEWKLKFSVDGTNNPKTIDLTFVSGPLKGQTWLGAYKWGGNDNNTLIMEFQHPGLDLPRPREVARTSENRPLLIFLRPKPQTLVVNELISLQGMWTLRNYDAGSWPIPGGKRPDQFGKGSELRWTVRGNEIAWLDENGAEIKATFTIDTSFSPKHFDLTFLSGPNSGKVCKGIYQRGNVAKDMLWICIAEPTSSSDRPKFFSAKHETGHSLLSLYPYQPSAKP